MAANMKVCDLIYRLANEASVEIARYVPRDKYLDEPLKKHDYCGWIQGYIPFINVSGSPISTEEQVEEKIARTKGLKRIHDFIAFLEGIKDRTLTKHQDQVLDDLSSELKNIKNAPVDSTLWHAFIGLIKQLANSLGLATKWSQTHEYTGPMRASFWKNIKVPTEAESQEQEQNRPETSSYSIANS
jgi:hypothetical protein